MIVLRNFNYKDIPVLQEHGYDGYSRDGLKDLIAQWNSKLYEKLYFESFAIDNGGEVVGYASLYQRSKSIVSCGVEIYEDYRLKGYASAAYGELLDYAKEHGYKIAVAQVLADNVASIALHNKLGFECENYEYINRKGNKVYYFIKTL